ncbi:MAG: hypothetical protein FJ265_07815 [Planctomycetes bacterium]|nr:hypothetical protein [Planctomycetota bacterium]
MHSLPTPFLRLLPLLLAAAALAQEPLVQIGTPNAGNAGLALAPDGFARFAHDALFLAGRSTAADWPYVHPGPQDGWAGRAAHTFRLVFDLAELPPAAAGTFELGLLDAHQNHPPTVEVRLNGTALGKERLPAGAGDRTIHGEPRLGRRHLLRLPVPAQALRAGRNVLAIQNLEGSWFLYEHVALRVPGARAVPVADATFVLGGAATPGVLERDGKLWQPLVLDVARAGGPSRLPLRVDGQDLPPLELKDGQRQVEVLVPAVAAARDLAVECAGQTLAVPVRAIPALTIYLVPHSHTDIGYTHLQAEVEQRQVENLKKGIAHAQATADHSEGARFVWNVEVLWAADLYLRRLDEPARAAFATAVQKGQVALNGLYLNILAGLARPEELVQSTRLATQFAERFGVRIDTAMISDIPGHTWGLVPALAQAGIRYLSTSPNYFDRIGTAQVASADQPFWWEGPAGERVLTWNTWMGYALSHTWGARLGPERVASYLDHLASIHYPYDVAYIRWSGLGDNAEPEASICDFVQQWNARYRWPRLVISDQHAPFAALEQRHGDRLPVRRGDWTPYWEDGAGSSARETAMNRASADRLTQVGALWALHAPASWSAADAAAAWRNVLLYTEHTWGAHNSISQPGVEFVRAQWDVKRGYAETGDRLARVLFAAAAAARQTAEASPEPAGFDVVNTQSWPRVAVVRVPGARSGAGDLVRDDRGEPVPSQRLSTGELAVLAELPPFATRRYRVVAGAAATPAAAARAEGQRLDNGRIGVTLDPGSGDLVELRSAAGPGNFVDTTGGNAALRYLFFTGSDPARAETSGKARFELRERGPLVASFVVTSEAPGTVSLVREVELQAGADHVFLRALVDKRRAPAGPKGDYYGGPSKESLNFAFPFAVPEGQLRLELPLAGVIRPDVDQIPGSCKNWFSVGNWADVANATRGVTWITLDTPLVQAGGLTANLLNSQADPAVWRKEVGPTQALYAWCMNNHWGTNYRAWQEGPVAFRFALRPHGGFDPVAATRLATGLCQPLLVLPAAGKAPTGRARLSLDNDRVVVYALKPTDDKLGWIVRLQNLSEQAQPVAVAWDEPQPRSTWRSDTAEARGEEVRGPVTIPGWGLLTLRADR